MTALLTLNGNRAISAQLTISRYGAAVADVVLAESNPSATPAVLVIGNLTLKGTAFRTASFAGSRSTRFVGGAGGWRKTIKARGYAHDGGIRLSTILGDAARDCGETISIATDRVIGTAYVREKATAERTLHLLAARQWWIDPNGVTIVGPRPTGPITSAFTVVSWSGGRGRFEIATEDYASWMPGRTFAAPTITGTQTISMMQLTADNDGKLRLVIMTGSDLAEDRLLDELRAIVRAESPSLTYSGVWEYTIVSATSSTIDVTPTSDIVPPITKCPMTPGLLGEGVTPTPGSKCRVQFVNADPTRPECVAIIGTPVLSKVNATTFVELADGARPMSATGDLAGGIWPIVGTTRVLG